MTDNKGLKHSLLSSEPTLAEQLLASINSLLQAIKIHRDNNRLVLESVKKFLHISIRLMGEDEYITIQIASGRFYVCEEKLPFRKETSLLVENLLDYFDKRELLGIRFYASIKNATAEQILAFARLLNMAGEQKDPQEWLVLKIEDAKFHLQWVSIVQPESAGFMNFFTGLEPSADTPALSNQPAGNKTSDISSEGKSGPFMGGGGEGNAPIDFLPDFDDDTQKGKNKGSGSGYSVRGGTSQSGPNIIGGGVRLTF
ncbi:MAG: hypothetical protein KKB30_03200 [Proteobacteria bacterium]|nr:hypothetical protein [Pseudomonadota bacterium]MBU1716109.1 hypothetical protein [Pseudomonadota bacterium]